MNFKNYAEYKQMRDDLIKEAETMLENANKEGYEAKIEEINALDNDFEDYRTNQANLNALKDKSAAMPASLIDMKGTDIMNLQIKKNNDNEYREAFFNFLRGEQLEGTQREVFASRNGLDNAFTTVTEAAALPVQTLDMIWDLCTEQHSILNDIDIRRTGVTIKVVKRTAITAGKGSKKSSQATADELMKDTKTSVELSGKDFTATVELSYAAAKMSIDALESFIVKDIAEQVGWAMSTDVVETIESGMNADNKLVAASATDFTFKEIAQLFGKCKRCHGLTVYTSNTTLYNCLVAMVDEMGRPIFQNNAQEGANGSVLGASIKLEEAVADGKLLVGDPKRVIGNVVQDIMVENDRDIQKHTVIYSAYARMQAALIDDQSFASLSLAE